MCATTSNNVDISESQLHVVQVTSNSKKSSYMYSMQLSYNRTPLRGKGNGHLSITCDKSMQISLSPWD